MTVSTVWFNFQNYFNRANICSRIFSTKAKKNESFEPYLIISVKKSEIIEGELPIDRGTLVVTQGGEDRSVGEVQTELLYGLPQHQQVTLLRLVPYVVRRQVACPYDVVYVLSYRGALLIVYRLPYTTTDSIYNCFTPVFISCNKMYTRIGPVVQ